MPPPINPLNPPPQDERNLRKLLTEGLGSGGEEVEIGNVLRRGGKRGPMGADATFRGKIRPDQPGLRYNLLLIADADRGGQPRFVNLDTLRWVKALQRMARPWGDPQASHNTIPREERRYAKDATYTTSGGNLGVRHFYPPGYGPLDDEDAPESRRPKEPISELRGPAGRDRFAKWLTEGGIGTRTRDFSEGTAMDGLGAQFAAPGRGMLNDGGRWSRGRFMPKGAAERLAQSLGIQRIPMQGFSLSGGAADRAPGAMNHFFPGRRQRFSLDGSQQFGIRSIPPTASAYIDRLAAWRKPGGDVEPPDMPDREERESVLDSHPADYDETRVMTKQGISDALSRAGKLPEYQRLKARLGRVHHGGLDYDPSEMSDRVPTDAEKREIVGPNIMDTRMARIPSNLPPHVREMLSQYELERPSKSDNDEYYKRHAAWQANPTKLPQPEPPMLERHNLRYPSIPAQQEDRVNVPGSATDLRTRLLEMELNDPSVPHDALARSREAWRWSPNPGVGSASYLSPTDEYASEYGVAQGSSDISKALAQRTGDAYGTPDEIDAMALFRALAAKHGTSPHGSMAAQIGDAIRRNISRHRFSLGSQDFAIQPRQQLGALSNAQLVPIYLPQGNAPAVGVTPTGGYAPPPRNAALVPQRRFALGEEEMGGGMPGLGMQQQFRLNDDHESDGVQDVKAEPWTTVDSARRNVMQNLADRRQTPRYQKVPAQNVPLDQYTHQLSKRGDVSTWRNGGASIPRDRYGNVARQAGGERSWGDWWQGLNNGLEDWMKGPGLDAVKSGGRAIGQMPWGKIGRGALQGARVGARGILGGLGNAGLGAAATLLGLGTQDLGTIGLGLGGIARGALRTGLSPLAIGGGAIHGATGDPWGLLRNRHDQKNKGFWDQLFTPQEQPQFALGQQGFSREDDFGDLLSQLGLGSDIPPVADEPLMVPPQTPEEMMRARATINTAHGPRDLYDMDPEKISGYLRGQGVMTSGKPTQNRLRSVYGASGRIQPERAQQIVQGPHETGVAGRVADIIGDLPQQQAPSESPEQRRRRVSGRELGSFGLGEQDFGLLDTIKHIGSMVNPVTNYRNLREGGHGRLASGAMVGGGLLGDAMLTGFHPPLVSLGLGRYAQGRAQAADRASDERRAEWMRG